MQITTTFRQMEASDALREYAEEKIGRLERFDDGIREAHCVMKAQRETHSAEITLLVRKKTLRAAESSENMYASIDLATDKLSRQLKRYREKQNESARRLGRTVRHITEEKARRRQTARRGGPGPWEDPPGEHLQPQADVRRRWVSNGPGRRRFYVFGTPRATR